MCKLREVSLTVLVLLISTTALNAYSSPEQQFNFMRAKGGEEYDFEHKTENGTIFKGKTVNINTQNIHLMLDEDDVLYWAKIMPNEFENRTVVAKVVQPVERDDDQIAFKDDFFKFVIALSTGYLRIYPYVTKWDFKNVCFTKSNVVEKTFNYIVSSKNNARRYNGTTYRETDDPLVQRIHIMDPPQLNGIYEVMFTEAELILSETFCKRIRLIKATGALGIVNSQNLDPTIFKTLVG